MDMAATSGHLDMVRFLHEHRGEGCTGKAMERAAMNGRLDVVRFPAPKAASPKPWIGPPQTATPTWRSSSEDAPAKP
jgi:hypothetical protein